MIIGFNTEIEHSGYLFHVQTTDKGRDKHVIETLIYTGGEVRDSRRTDYGDLIKRGYDEKKVIKLMEVQHRRVIYAIKKGQVDAAIRDAVPVQPEQELLDQAEAEGRDLDDMILEYLSAQDETENLELVMSTRSKFQAGQAVFMRLLTSTSVTRQPVQGAEISVAIQGKGGSPALLYSGRTDDEGEVTVMVIIPDRPEEQSELLIEARSDLGEDVLRQQVGAAPPA